MLTLSALERRQSARTLLRERASLIIDRRGQPHRTPCLILDSSREGFRICGAFDLKRGTVVEVILDEHGSSTVLCHVRWVGQAGSKRGGEAGLQTKPAQLHRSGFPTR